MCVFIKNMTEMKSSSRWGHWGGGTYRSEEKKWAIKRSTSQRIGSEAEKKISMLKDMSATLKFATAELNYTSLKGIPIDRADVSSLISGWANAPSLCRIQLYRYTKNWYTERGELLRSTRERNYIVSRMAYRPQWSKTLIFINIAGGAYIKLVDVTRTTAVSDYQPTIDRGYSPI